MSKENVLFQVEEDALDSPVQEDEGAGSRKHLIFTVDDLKIGIDAEQVVEIQNSYTATYLPMMPDYILGIFNMRGQIIPIMDIRLRLGKPPADENILIVIDYNNNQLGIRVDSVDLMLDIPVESIVPIPSQSTQKLVSGMCTLPDGSGTMLVLDCEQLIAHGYGD
ncbi:chemotaxis protein CheW [uncultured Oscillibacter sp.]|uniref:chemotaxis protein CheW n=1 Tax=uncultured Oscillibacter sp. TaxID=876091 RepID=UPI0025FC4E1F|nr:chemotaxis protein CheW [uncultured Oscillibacter sp.]